MLKAFLIITATLSGCAFTPEKEVEQSRQIAIATIPTCSSDKECEVKWSAARAWILANAGWKIKLITNDFIETYSAVGGETTLSVRVVKEPMQNGTYRLNASIWCDNMWGCIPDKWVALKNMHAYINRSWSEKSQ